MQLCNDRIRYVYFIGNTVRLTIDTRKVANGFETIFVFICIVIVYESLSQNLPGLKFDL